MGSWKEKSILFGEYIIWIFRMFCLNIVYFTCDAYDFSHISFDAIYPYSSLFLIIKIVLDNSNCVKVLSEVYVEY